MDIKHWNNHYLKTRRNLTKRKRRILYFQIPREFKILDIGCGDGLDLKIFKQLGYKDLTGLDNSEELIGLAKQSVEGVTFVVGSADETPFADNSFDVVYVNTSIHHLTDFKKFLLEIKRILKNDGLFCFIEPHQTWARKILDFITLSKIIDFIPLFKNRRVQIEEEIELYNNFLKKEKMFLQLLDEYNFYKLWYKTDLFSQFAKFIKK